MKLFQTSENIRKLQESKQCSTGIKSNKWIMEENRETRCKPTHLHSINLQQRKQEYKMGKMKALQQEVLGNLDCSI